MQSWSLVMWKIPFGFHCSRGFSSISKLDACHRSRNGYGRQTLHYYLPNYCPDSDPSHWSRTKRANLSIYIFLRLLRILRSDERFSRCLTALHIHSGTAVSGYFLEPKQGKQSKHPLTVQPGASPVVLPGNFPSSYLHWAYQPRMPTTRSQSWLQT